MIRQEVAPTAESVEQRRRAAVAEIESRLIDTYGDIVGVDAVRECVRAAASAFEAAPVQTYVPLLIERKAINALRS
jgi:hypothetical protein